MRGCQSGAGIIDNIMPFGYKDDTNIYSISKNMPTKRHQPKGFKILHEDRDLIVGNKAAGFLTVAALYDKTHTIHNNLNQYVRKGNSKSRNCVYVVHRLDRETSGVLVFAKSPQAKDFLKDNWKSFSKIYHAVVHGHMTQKSGIIENYLSEDEDYVVHSSEDEKGGKLARTAYKVIKETPRYSLVEINLLTGRKNQIRVHFSGAGHPVVGDTKYGSRTKCGRLALHSSSISFLHPFSRQSMIIQAPLPDIFDRLMGH